MITSVSEEAVESQELQEKLFLICHLSHAYLLAVAPYRSMTNENSQMKNGKFS